MNKKICLLMWITFLCLLFGCNEKAEINIVAEDAYDVPAGEYTLRYEIENYDRYESSYHLSLSVHVYDEENNELSVTNRRTVTVESGHLYTVVIRVTGSDKENINIFKQYTVSTIPENIVVCFYLRDGNSVKALSDTPYISVPYGGTLSLSSLPDIPLFYESANEVIGVVRRIIAKKWVFIDENEVETDVTQESLSHLTQDLVIYSSYQYEYTVSQFTVTFVSNGGTPIADFVGNNRSNLVRPTDPTQEGKVFLGWYTDEECTEPYNWKADEFMSGDMTLYAKWATSNLSVATPVSYFRMQEETDNEGNKYYILSVKDTNRLPKNVILPNCFQDETGLFPVRAIQKSAFTPASGDSPMETLFIPNTYTLDMANAFISCKKLTEATFEEGNPREDLPSALFRFCTALKKVTLPENITAIADNCFAECIALGEITLPTGLLYIKTSAFQNCKSLTAVSLPDSVVILYGKCFSGCENLSSLTFSSHSSVKTITSSALDGTALTGIVLPSSVQTYALDNTAITVTFYPKE